MHKKSLISIVSSWPFWGTIGVILVMAAYAIISIPEPREDMEFGVTFSVNYTEELGLDTIETYNAMLEDLRVKYVRLPIYWNQIEAEEGNYNFELYDHLIRRAEDLGVSLTAVVGRRQPRWPECHIPEWAKDFSETVQRRAVLRSIETVVNRYKNSPAIDVWQVENEPLFGIFGECPAPDYDFLVEEINLVKTLDPERPIQITDSGELSTWLHTAYLGDQLGISMYRITWNKHFGYWYYPLSPKFYTYHGALIYAITDHIVISELQAEPWFPDQPVHETPLKEQYKSMNPDLFWKNVDFARRTQFEQAYLWGVEWWYWLKIHKNQPVMWDIARQLFRS